MKARQSLLAAGAMLTALTSALPARATYSIVAADSQTGDVGIGVTSCVGSQSLASVYSFVPGVGAVVAQARANPIGRDYAKLLLASGKSATDIVPQLSSASFDIFAGRRQYGVVTTSGSAAAWTGPTTGAISTDAQGVIGGIWYSAQGNILTSAAVIGRAQEGFRGDACDLPERLLRALEAGTSMGEGDKRCVMAKGTPSDSAYLRVDRADGSGPLIELSVSNTGAVSGVAALRQAFDAWRAQHPCAPAKPCPF